MAVADLRRTQLCKLSESLRVRRSSSLELLQHLQAFQTRLKMYSHVTQPPI